jgi:S-adenosylmethionine:tRNA ribosyltransferase-isomerase
MMAAAEPRQRPPDAKLMVIDERGSITHVRRASLDACLRAGDVVVANDATALPASLRGVHARTGCLIEVRLAGRRSLDEVHDFTAVVFGAGDFHARTEDRPAPPWLSPGDRLTLGPLSATIARLLTHPRLVDLHLDGPADAIWAGLARHGRPIQYAYVPVTLELWDAWSPVAGRPVAFEAPSAGFALDWHMVERIRSRGAAFATVTHTAGISSTGDVDLDRMLPFDEPYRISEATAAAVESARARGNRVIAIGTTVVRALEHAAIQDGHVHAGDGLATQRIGPGSRLRVVDAILTGVHEAGTSHYELLRAFADAGTLVRAERELEDMGYRTHEFGDSVLIEKRQAAYEPGPTSTTQYWTDCRAKPIRIKPTPTTPIVFAGT